MKNKIVLDLPIRTVFIYLVLGFVWILFSDGALAFLVRDLETYQGMQTYKGWFFIIMTGMLLYPIIAPRFYEVKALSDSLSDQNRALEAALSEVSEQQAFIEAIYNSSNTAIMVWKTDGTVVTLNKALTDLLGYSLADMLHKNWSVVLMGDHSPKWSRDIVMFLEATHQPYKHENTVNSHSGERKVLHWSHNLLQDPKSKETLVVSFGVDKTQERLQEEYIYKLGNFDSLTTLGNQYKFEMDLGAMMSTGRPFYLVAIQLEDLQRLTGIYGHKFGELLINEFSNLLKTYFEESFLYRWQPNKFIARCHGESETTLMQKLLAMSQQMPPVLTLNDIEVELSFVTGIVSYPEHGDHPTTLIRNLYFTLKMAIAEGSRKVVLFNESILKALEHEMEMERQLDEALHQNQLEVYFQPIISMKDKSCHSAEVLLRWFPSELSFGSIGELIAMAEKTGQVYKIDRWVIDRVFQQVSQETDVFKGIQIAINLSAQSFNSEDLLPYLEEKIKQYDVTPSGFEFELTEYTLLDKPEQTLKILEDIKAMGFMLSLDDFGTKYSSLNYLSILPFDSLKIDKSYIDQMIHDPKHQIIIEEILRLSMRLGLNTVAEGVEEIAQVEWLTQMGCDYAQGYYFYKPMSFKAFKDMLGDTTP